MLADGTPLSVHRFEDRWISAARGDMSYELDRQTYRMIADGEAVICGTERKSDFDKLHSGALPTTAESMFVVHRARVTELAARDQLPAMYCYSTLSSTPVA
jgi:hypothetical protein